MLQSCHYTLGVIHIGSPSCGMNAAVRSFVRNCIYRGDKVKLIKLSKIYKIFCNIMMQMINFRFMVFVMES